MPAARPADQPSCIRWMAAAILFVAVVPSPANAQQAGRVRLASGVELPGEIVTLSPNGIEVETDGKPRKFAIESVKEVRFDAEPDALRNARGLLLRKDGAAALAALGGIEPGEMDGADREIRAELEFVTSAATARQSLATGVNLAGAQKAVNDFLAAHPRSHHLYSMQEMLGDLLAGQGKPAEAAAAYGVLEKGPPGIAMRAATLKAALLYRQRDYAEALRAYEAAARGAGSLPAAIGPEDSRDPLQRGIDKARAAAAMAVKRDADLGRARCLTRLGKTGEAITVARAALGDADADDGEGLGRIFNALGDAQRTASEQLPPEQVGERNRDALISFLTVHLVHNTAAANDAEALFNLVELWDRGNNPERSRAARRTLETSYPDSSWAKRLPPAKAP
jgi:tetratricopeptide (TPR) repeat protein